MLIFELILQHSKLHNAHYSKTFLMIIIMVPSIDSFIFWRDFVYNIPSYQILRINWQNSE